MRSIQAEVHLRMMYKAVLRTMSEEEKKEYLEILHQVEQERAAKDEAIEKASKSEVLVNYQLDNELRETIKATVEEILKMPDGTWVTIEVIRVK